MSISYTVQQLSVFLENRAGRLDDVLKVLSEGGDELRPLQTGLR